MTGAFRYAHGAGADWGQVAKTLATGLGDGADETDGLGFLYLTEQLAGDAASVLTFLRETTGVENWVGAVGYGVAATRTEYFNEPAGVALVAPFGADQFKIIDTIGRDLESQDMGNGGADVFTPAGGGDVALAVIHGDGTNAAIPEVIAGFAEQSGAFLVGGLTALTPDAQVAGGVTGGGLSGVVLAPGLGQVTGLSQGCVPIGPAHVITDGQDDVLVELDRRPALDVFIEDIGPDLAAQLEQAGQMVHAALLVPGSDQGDYLVRNLTGIDPDQGLLSIGEIIDTGQTMMFCVRNRDTAVADLKRMVVDLDRRLDAPARGGLYFSCVARGPNQFGPGSQEMSLIADALGDIPLAGFYANGEIFNHRLYGYTGVLVLFP
jgi:small ligand-binding sensory domain FIST